MGSIFVGAITIRDGDIFSAKNKLGASKALPQSTAISMLHYGLLEIHSNSSVQRLRNTIRKTGAFHSSRMRSTLWR